MYTTSSKSTALLPHLTSPQIKFGSSESTWVKLRHLPSPYSFDEALLVCECSEGRWVAWVPDFGEILLSANEFYWLD